MFHTSSQGGVFVGTTDIAGYYSILSRGLSELKYNFYYVQLTPHVFSYENPKSTLPFLVRLPCLIAKFRLKFSIKSGQYYSTPIYKRIFLSLCRLPCYLLEGFFRTGIVLPWAIFKCDIFCFGARSNIVGVKAGYWDIRLLKLLGKKIIFVYHGSDSRPPYINGAVLHGFVQYYPQWEKKLYHLTKKWKKIITLLDSLADVVIENPFSGHFHCRPFVNWFSVGISYHGVNKEIADKTNIKNHLVRILHAPSHRMAKGSDTIIACINQLKEENYPLELILINGRPHHEVIDEIHQCDFVIDELHSDSPMAGFAAEASYYGKPVIVCGYLKDESLIKKIPTWYCRPEQLREAVLKFIGDVEFRCNLGAKAQHFLKTEWSYLNVAKNFIKIFSGDIPPEWVIDPKSISYLLGAGINEELLKKYLSSFVQTQGVSALQLDDKPILRDAFLSFLQLGMKNENQLYAQQ